MTRSVLFALLLAGCVQSLPPAPEPVPDLPKPLPEQNACGAAELQDLVGQSAKRLETMRFAGAVRVIRPGMAVTEDYSPQRLNIQVDEAEVITSLTCG